MSHDNVTVSRGRISVCRYSWCFGPARQCKKGCGDRNQNHPTGNRGRWQVQNQISDHSIPRRGSYDFLRELIIIMLLIK